MTIIEQDMVQTDGATDEPMLIFSEEAVNRLTKLRDEKELDASYALRVFVQGGGCSGLQYGMTFDEMRDGDSEMTAYGLHVLVDSMSAVYLRGSTVDYIDSIMGGGFKIENPNSASGCGCGKSFRSKDSDGSEGAEGEAAEAAGGCGSCSSGY